MRYRVIVTPQAESELRSTHNYIRKHAPDAARTWIRGVRREIRSLTRFPERAPLAQESSSFQEPIREILYGRGNRGTYRILFIVIEKSVFILHVRHGSMLPLKPDE